MAKRLIYAEDVLEILDRDKAYMSDVGRIHAKNAVNEAPTVDAILTKDIHEYLQARLDEWDALGDRKWDRANMWGYNFIMACFDDLERRTEDGN